MKAVANAIEAGRCSVAVSGALLRDPDVVLALKERAGLAPMTLSGAPASIVGAVSDKGLARSIAQPNGVLVLVEPELSDAKGLGEIAKIIARAPHKPSVFVVARQFNPFAFGALSGLKIEHIKGRGKTFVRDLPQPPAGQEAVSVDLVKPKKGKGKGGSDKAPKFVFVGRDDEMAALAELLASPGPIVVSGPHGIGKHTLVEHALAASELTRLPDFSIGRNFGFDALVARLAHICKAHGAPQLHNAAKKTDAKPVDLVAAATEALAAMDQDAVMMLDGLHTALGRQRDFFRKSRMELLLIALLTTPSKLRLLFCSIDQPILYREGQAQHLRRLELGGLKGRFLFEIFDAYKAPEFPRERFGAISEKIGGHPFAARTYAVDVRDRPDGLALTEDAKYLKLEDGDLEKLKRRIGRKVDKLPAADRSALALIAHVPHSVDASEISRLGLNRKARLSLLAEGLLDMTGTENDRRFRVHPLVRSCLTWRETSDFDVLRDLADRMWTDLKDAEGLDGLVKKQIFNLYCTSSRQHRRRTRTDLPDNDSMVESCIGMIRSKKPNFQLAKQRLAEIVNAHPGNSDAHLLRLELADTEERASNPGRGRNRKGGRPEKKADKPVEKTERAPRGKDFEAFAAAAVAQAPVPEIFHRIVGHWLGRRSRNKAIEALQAGVEALPQEARLHCRLGALQLRHGRRNEALAALKHAMELQPMLPDAYGLLGMAKRDEGADALDDAENLLREAVRLAPEDPVQTARLADLLIDRAATTPDAGQRSDRFAEAKTLLETALQGDRKAPEAQLLLAQLHRRSGGDLERAEWLLKQAKKNSDRHAERHHRIHLERALILLARGDADGAEAIARDQVSRNASNHAVYATLAQVLEARQQFIPAHAEFLRAKERAPAKSLWGATYDTELLRIQGLIEAQAAGLIPAAPVEPAPAAPAPSGRSEATGNTAHRVIRRKGAAAEAASAETQPVEAVATAETAPADAAATAETAVTAETAPTAEAAPTADVAEPESPKADG